MNIKTFEDYLLEMANIIKAKIEKLLLEYSSLKYINPIGDSVVIVNISGDYHWQKLPLEGKRLQSELLQLYDTFKAILSILIKSTSTSDTTSFKESDKIIKESIVQSASTWSKTTQEAFDKVSKAFDKIQELLTSLYSSKEDYLLIPDTNALLTNPNIDRWSYKEFDKFTLILTPTVLAELDSLKVHHKNQSVRNKCKKIVRQIKEYRRRGRLNEGVTVVKDKIKLQSIAVEPSFSESLYWLDPNNNDDRFIATVYEIITRNLRSVVCLVTSDINLQNKAECACLPYCEPP